MFCRKKKVWICILLFFVVGGCKEQNDYKLTSMPNEVKKIGGYKDIVVNNIYEGSKKELIDSEINKIILKNKIYETEGCVRLNRWITIGIQVKDGKKIYGSISNKTDYYVEKEEAIDGLNDGILDLVTNKKKTFEVKFDNNYEQKELRGKKCKCTVMVYGIFVKPTELKQADIKKIKENNFKSVDEMKKYVERKVDNQIYRKCKEYQFNEIIEEIVSKSEMTGFSSERCEEERVKIQTELKKSAKKQGMEYEKYVMENAGIEKKEIDTYVNNIALEKMEEEVVLEAIAYKEKIAVNKKEITQYVKKYTNYSSEEEYLKMEHVKIEELQKKVLIKKTYEYLISKIKVE